MLRIFTALLLVCTVQLQAQNFYSVSPAAVVKYGDNNYPEGWIKVYKDSFTGFIDSNGVEVVPPIYDEIGAFGDVAPGLAVVVRGELSGLINYAGQLIADCKYDYIEKVDRYRQGWLHVQRDGLQGFIDLEGKEVVNATYDEIEPPSKP